MSVMDDVKQRAQEKEEKRKFFQKLDSQHLLFETYTYAVMGKFKVDAQTAGKMIGEHMNGEY